MLNPKSKKPKYDLEERTFQFAKKRLDFLLKHCQELWQMLRIVNN